MPKKPETHADIARMVRAGYDRIAGRYLASRTLDHDLPHLQAFADGLPIGARVFDLGCGCVPIGPPLFRERLT